MIATLLHIGAPDIRPARRGFTLVELLIVCVILAILAALLLPVLAEVLGVARGLQCRSQLNRIGAAYRQYTTDSKGLWPPILTGEAPADVFKRIEEETGLVMAPARPAAGWGQPGPHWSIVLWPYLKCIDIYTCPADPKAGLRGSEVVGPGREHAAALLDAPPESYALNVILFRTADDMRRQAGCTWGVRGDADFSGLAACTTLSEQREMFPGLPSRILFFCGASGLTVGSQSNIPFRAAGGLADRWDWHPHRASAPFADEPGCGSNYLFVDGHVEFRDELPDLWEWGYELTRTPGRP
jgi:prepilin-type N-terminal cleavage/methylation domain-containing protein/prepilin-type processing-associated H-X9-DG protein